MRAVVQRVTNASVEAEGSIRASIGTGIMALAGFHSADTRDDMKYILGKILNLRIFGDEKGNMNHSMSDIGGELLVVPQFTLYGDARKGRRPSFSDAMPPERASLFFADFMELCKLEYQRVKFGIFGADMKVSLVNSGPVTILLDSRRLF